MDGLVCVDKNTNIRAMTQREQNIMKWVALFHDITKRGPSEFEGKDHVDPFNSAMNTLEVFHELGILVLRTYEERINFQNVLSLIKESHQPEKTA